MVEDILKQMGNIDFYREAIIGDMKVECKGDKLAVFTFKFEGYKEEIGSEGKIVIVIDVNKIDKIDKILDELTEVLYYEGRFQSYDVHKIENKYGVKISIIEK